MLHLKGLLDGWMNVESDNQMCMALLIGQVCGGVKDCLV